MQVRSIKAEFGPSTGIYIMADCLIGKLNLKIYKKKRDAATGLETSLETNTKLNLAHKRTTWRLEAFLEKMQ